MAYHPETQAFYIPLNLHCEKGTFLDNVKRVEGGGGAGGVKRTEPDASGKPRRHRRVPRDDDETGKILWRHRTRTPPNTAALTTGGGLVVIGDWDRYLSVHDATNGKILFQTRLSTSVHGLSDHLRGPRQAVHRRAGRHLVAGDGRRRSRSICCRRRGWGRAATRSSCSRYRRRAGSRLRRCRFALAPLRALGSPLAPLAAAGRRPFGRRPKSAQFRAPDGARPTAAERSERRTYSGEAANLPTSPTQTRDTRVRSRPASPSNRESPGDGGT